MRRLLLPLLLLATTATAAGRFSFTYIYKSGDQAHLRSNGGDIDSLVKTSKRWTGEFVWLRRDGQEYLIRDAGVLSAVKAAFAEMHALEPRLRAAEERRHIAEHEAEQLEAEMDRLEAIAERKFEQIVVRAIEAGKAQRV
jgi:hypothetical protein